MVLRLRECRRAFTWDCALVHLNDERPLLPRTAVFGLAEERRQSPIGGHLQSKKITKNK